MLFIIIEIFLIYIMIHINHFVLHILSIVTIFILYFYIDVHLFFFIQFELNCVTKQDSASAEEYIDFLLSAIKEKEIFYYLEVGNILYYVMICYDML